MLEIVMEADVMLVAPAGVPHGIGNIGTERQGPTGVSCESYLVCPVCGGEGFLFRAKLVCGQCHAIIETCCD